MNKAEAIARKKTAPSVGIRYEETAALFTTQVVVNSIEETVLLECSSGYLQQPGGQGAVLPIQSRLAMSTTTARKLGTMLLDVADEMEGIEEDEIDDTPSDCSDWLNSASSLQSNLRKTLNRLPRIDEEGC